MTGARVRQLRSLVGLSTRELSALIGGAHSYVGMVERRGVEPSGKLLVAIARVLGASPSWLTDGEGEPPTVEEIRAAVERAREAMKNAAATIGRSTADGCEPEFDPGPLSSAPAALAVFDGHPVSADTDVPRVRDEDLAEWLGGSRARDIRKDLIRPFIERGTFENAAKTSANPGADAARAWVSRQKPNGLPRMTYIAVKRIIPGVGNLPDQEVVEYWLDRAAALKVVINSKTERADRVQDELIGVFLLAEQGKLPGQSAPSETVAIPSGTDPSVFFYLQRKAALESALARGEITRAHFEAKVVELLDECGGGTVKLTKAPKALVFEAYQAMQGLAANETFELKRDGKVVGRAHGLVDPGDCLTARAVAERFAVGSLRANPKQVNEIARALGIFGDEAGGWGCWYAASLNLTTASGPASSNWLHSPKSVERLEPYVLDVARAGQARLLPLVRELNPAYADELEAKQRESNERRRQTNAARKTAGHAPGTI